MKLEDLNRRFSAKYLDGNRDKFERFADGDVGLMNVDYNEFVVPVCDRCGGTLKPGGE